MYLAGLALKINTLWT